MDLTSPYALIIEASVILILSFFFGELSKKTSIPSVLLLIILGVLIKMGLETLSIGDVDFFPVLEMLGIVGLIMIVLEAALELKLERDKILPIGISFAVAAVGLLLSTWITAMILQYYIDGMDSLHAWLYATPLSILSSAIIIPSVVHLRGDKKEFHIYESTFSDILGIMLFYFLTAKIGSVGGSEEMSNGLLSYGFTVVLTVLLSLVFSYIVILLFQLVDSDAKQFLLLSVLLLLYSIGKLMHLSSLLIILIFGLVIANMDLFFKGPLKKLLEKEKAQEIYHGLHVVTMETAFVVRTFFFVIFGITIVFSSLASWNVFAISALCIAVIYVIRWVLLRSTVGTDILPQVWIAPRGLITVLLYYAIPVEAKVEGFSEGILLFIIIGTSLIMTFGMIADKRRSRIAINRAKSNAISESKWKAPEI